MKHKLRNLTVSLLALASVTFTQAQDFTYNGVEETWTGSSSGYVTTDGAGTTSIVPNSSGSASSYVGSSAWFNLGTTITTGSGIWTVSMTLDQNTPGGASNVFAGFGNATSVNGGTVMRGGPGLSGLFEGYAGAGNGPGTGFGSQGSGNYTSMGVTSGNIGFVDSGYYVPVTYDNGISVFEGTNTQSTPTNYTMVLDTTNAAWTVQFYINGNLQSYIDTKTGQTVNEITYATDPTGVDEFGLSTLDEGADFSNITVTETPEPSTYAMIFAGVAMLAFVVRRRSAVNA